jgi:hypothetical protein
VRAPPRVCVRVCACACVCVRVCACVCVCRTANRVNCEVSDTRARVAFIPVRDFVRTIPRIDVPTCPINGRHACTHARMHARKRDVSITCLRRPGPFPSFLRGERRPPCHQLHRKRARAKGASASRERLRPRNVTVLISFFLSTPRNTTLRVGLAVVVIANGG